MAGTGVIELRSDRLWAIVDPEHGAEVVRLTELSTGLELLGTPPFAPAPPLGGDLDEATWTERYRGGWQVLAPNAGMPCEVDGNRHGFHGRASVDPWQLVEHDATHVVLTWTGHGVRLRRCLRLAGATVTADLSWTAVSEPVPLIATEHICFGRTLLDPEVEIVAEARAHEASDIHGPAIAPTGAAVWPECRLLDGSLEDAGRWRFSEDRARFLVLTGLARGHAEIRNAGAGVSVALDWDAAKLPATWVWHEVRGSGGIWGHEAELLGFEPSVAPHTLGLNEAVARGQALQAQPGRWDGYSISLELKRTAGGAYGS